jgi:RNA polymerase sigma factor (sigma-70 family)
MTMDRKLSKEANWELVYNSCAPILYNYGQKITSDTQLAEDCIQDVFTELWEKRDTLHQIHHIKAYLIKVFRRRVISKIGRVQQQISHSDFGKETEFNVSFSFEASLIQDEICEAQKKRLQRALQNLTHRQKEAIYLRFYEGHSYAEIAEIMNLEKSAVYSLIYKAMTHLREELKDTHFAIDAGVSLLSFLFLCLN